MLEFTYDKKLLLNYKDNKFFCKEVFIYSL